MNHIKSSVLLLFVFLSQSVIAQDDLMALLAEEDSDSEQYATSTFKSTRLINGHNVEVRTKNILEFIISHRFGRINQGVGEFYGLDQAQIRFGLEYGVTDRLNVGLGRSSFNKVYDGFLKYKILRQSNTMPVTLTGFGSLAIRTVGYGPDLSLDQTQKMAHTIQGLIARKFNSELSLQLVPTWIHRNFVLTRDDPNDLFALGLGGRYKITNRVTINGEYFALLNNDNDLYQNAIALGVDIETGGHVFQLHLTNAQQIVERGFIGETDGEFFNGDIYFGFNISRVFDLTP